MCFCFLLTDGGSRAAVPGCDCGHYRFISNSVVWGGGGGGTVQETRDC